MSGDHPLPPTMLDISSSHVTENERIFSCPHVVVTLQPETPAPAAREEPPRWVLVEGCHDSGSINGVYGPYTEAYIDWLLAAPLQYHSGNWTKVKLSSGPGES